ncbi:hypothetical protein OHB26_03660 [Nocardia sp. NBC_01503]|uniref:hypothetical protein n=1 Tax=Nocardia sp. NBC_01503 TaxID=2975997 RepID=UPI002E7C1ED4|nr:hypothetical protein [Nocardia sp. NBC_01503]WTL33353.1 hypothetical protein OHB26_03660 [Nocardia sp. NBC_01503]
MAHSIDVAALLDIVVSQLRAAGIRASVDPRDLNPPCAWVAARTVAHDLLGGGGTVTADIYLIAPNIGVPQALKTLTGLLDQALTVIAPDADTSLSERVPLPSGGDPLPAFRITVDLETC